MTAKKIKNRGFTLLETLVAVFILSTAIVGPLSIASRSLHNALIARDQVTAFFLAQDAVEYVRFARDTNTLSGADWLTGQGGTTAGVDLTQCATGNGCILDSTSNNPAVPSDCGAAACPNINYDSSTSLYTYASIGGTVASTTFNRKVILTPVGSLGNEEQVTVTVGWTDSGGLSHAVTVFENLFKWQ